jgi:3-phenylpropionate/trans-cinnamate dioxygenase ferredoxin reductase subunit
MTEDGMVIVGAGEAGARAAVELREQGWTGSITLIGEEKHAPYERPPLSKAQLLAEEEPSPIFILNEERLEQHRITFMAGSTVARIDRDSRTVVMADGNHIKYEKLLLATGARPRKFALEGSDTSKVLYLRTFADALDLRKQLLPGKHVAVIGGGFIGLETAASAIDRGCTVTLIELGPRILMRGVPEEIARIVEARHLAAGVEFRYGVGIERIESSGERQTIVLADGSTVDCDAVIIGIGAVPETKLAVECGLEIENGVCTNEQLRTSDPHIYAAGDCCSFPHKLYGGKRIRLEAWRNAQDQGAHAAMNMLGAEEPYTTVPWFWSDQYEQTLQVAGIPDNSDRIIEREAGENSRLFFHLNADGRLVAASGVGQISKIAKDIRVAEMLIHQQLHPNIQELVNPDVKLKSLLQT